MINNILKSGVSCTFSQYFDLPFTIDDILAELGCTIERTTLNLPRKPLSQSLELLQRELARNQNRVELVNEIARREALIGPILFEVAERSNQRINVEYSIVVNEHLRELVETLTAILGVADSGDEEISLRNKDLITWNS